MKTIWKFPLELTDLQSIEMPQGSEILSVQMQRETLCLWALAEPSLKREIHIIEIAGTGNPLPDAKRRFIGTAQMKGGTFVWHIFERTQ